jgi:hypothetical protein
MSLFIDTPSTVSLRALIRKHARMNERALAALLDGTADYAMGLYYDENDDVEMDLIDGLDKIKPEPLFPGQIEENGDPRPYQVVRFDGILYAKFTPPHEMNSYLIVIDEREVIEIPSTK